MDSDLAHRLKPLLAPGERLLWAGRPPKARAWREERTTAMFWILWTALTGGVFVLLPLMAGFWPMLVMGVPFALLGVWMLQRAWRHLQLVDRTAYAVTDRRAMLVDLASGEAQAYEGADLAAIRKVRHKFGGFDVVFTTDSRSRSFVPSKASSGGSTSYMPIGFAEPTEVEAFLGHLEALKAATGAMRPRCGADPALVIASRGGMDAFLVKLRSALKDRLVATEARHRRTWGRFKLGVGLAVLGALWVFTRPLDGEERMVVYMVAGMFALGLTVVGFAIRSTHEDERKAMATDDAFRSAIAGWRPDVHPKSPLLGYCDLGDADGLKPVRSAQSPHSGATKTYHKHHWGQLSWAFADGTMVAITLVDKVKYKSGNEVKRSHHVRGRLSVNPAMYGSDNLLARFKSSQLDVRTVSQDGRLHLCFTGTLSAVEDLPAELAGLYRRLEAKRSYRAERASSS